MKHFLLRDLLAPTITRVGAALAGYLVATYAADPQTASQIGVGISAIGLLLVDLITRKIVERP